MLITLQVFRKTGTRFEFKTGGYPPVLKMGTQVVKLRPVALPAGNLHSLLDQR